MNALRHCALAGFLLLVPLLHAASRDAWIATWTTSPESGSLDHNDPLLKLENQTVRERVRVTLGGAQICLRLSNEFGSSPLIIGEITVASPTDAASVRPGSIHAVTFGGRASITIPPGAPVLSDPVAFAVAPGAEISISVYFPERVATPTLHSLALKRAVVSQRGDHARAEKIEPEAVSQASILVSAVLVPARPSQRLIVAFGDSITDGDQSTVDTDQSWPSDLWRRLARSPGASKIAVVNEGILGNRLLRDGGVSGVSAFGPAALARFDRDALAVPGVTHIVLLEGINDMAFPGTRLGGRYLADPADARTAEELIVAYLQLIARAHARGVKVIGATMTPFEGAEFPGYYSPAKEAARQAVNRWIRTSGAFDGVIDFDAVLRDPDHPGRILPRFASRDLLHPNDDGYRAMADAVDLALFH